MFRDRVFEHYGQELQLQRHLQEAIEITSRGVSFVVSSGTGSGHSIGLLMPIGTGQDSRDQKLVDEVQDMELLLLDALHTHRGDGVLVWRARPEAPRVLDETFNT